MTTVNARGFTIIETVLFLGISGALFAALIVGMNNNLVQQHYRESVQNFLALLQDQYAEVANTRIERNDELRCNVNLVDKRITVDELGAAADLPGAPSTDPACVVLGKAIELEPDTSVLDGGTLVHVYPVIGRDFDSDQALSDFGTLIEHFPTKTSVFGASTQRIDWGSSIKRLDRSNSQASILILRSPSSGLIRIFASDTQLETNLSDMITNANATRELKVCIDGQRGLLPKQMIVVDAKIAGSNGIAVKANTTECV